MSNGCRSPRALDDIPVFINHRIDNHRAPNVRLARERRIHGSAEYVLACGSICEPTRTIFVLAARGGGVGADVPVPPRTPPIWPPITPPGTPPSTPPKSGAASPTLSELRKRSSESQYGAVSCLQHVVQLCLWYVICGETVPPAGPGRCQGRRWSNHRDFVIFVQVNCPRVYSAR